MLVIQFNTRCDCVCLGVCSRSISRLRLCMPWHGSFPCFCCVSNHREFHACNSLEDSSYGRSLSEGLMPARRLDPAHETGSRACECIVWVVWPVGIAIPFEGSSTLLLHHIESSHEVY